MAVTKVGSSDFDSKVLGAKGVSVVDLYADWCGPCKMMAPVIDGLSSQYEDVSFFKLNVDESGDIAQRYGVMSIPTFLFIKDGQVVKSMVGARGPEAFEEEINALK
ncbi:MAG: thioredoxin [Eubacterium sp.]|nr:thioredoxin [Eubacterium sp.]